LSRTLLSLLSRPIIHTRSLHDALPIYRIHAPHGRFRNRYALLVEGWLLLAWPRGLHHAAGVVVEGDLPASIVSGRQQNRAAALLDRKSTRLNSSHQIISYAVFCLKKKK